MRTIYQFSFDITIGSHQWHGIIPSFVSNLIMIISVIIFELIIVSFEIMYDIIIMIIIVEADA